MAARRERCTFSVARCLHCSVRTEPAKSTALRVIAGLLPASGGHVRVGERTWEDHASGVRLATEQRSIGVVFQDYLLFPTMTARDNVAFGLRAKGAGETGRPRNRERVAGTRRTARPGRPAACAVVRRAGAAGGAGQGARDDAGRVAPRRAARRARCRHSDERARRPAQAPGRVRWRDRLGHARSARRVDPRRPGGGHRRRRCRADRHTAGDHPQPQDALRRPTRRTQPLRRPVDRHAGQLLGGAELVTAEAHEGAVFVVARPSSISVHRDLPHGSPRNVWAGTVTTVEQHGDLVRLFVTGPPDVVVDVTTGAMAELALAVAERVWLSVKATDLTVYGAGDCELVRVLESGAAAYRRSTSPRCGRNARSTTPPPTSRRRVRR